MRKSDCSAKSMARRKKTERIRFEEWIALEIFDAIKATVNVVQITSGFQTFDVWAALLSAELLRYLVL